ncbi:unnamed protein product [Diamesa serratosioi]
MIIVEILCFVLLSNCFLAAPIDDTTTITTTSVMDVFTEMTTMSDVLHSQSTMKIIAENEISAEIGEIEEATNEIQDDNEMTGEEIQDMMVNVDVSKRKLESAEAEVKELKPETTTVQAETTTNETEIETTEVLNDTEEIQKEDDFFVDNEDDIISKNIPQIDEKLSNQMRAIELVKEYSDEEYTAIPENVEIENQESTSESQRYEKFYEKSGSEEKVIAYDFETKQYVYVDKEDEQQFNEHQKDLKKSSTKTPTSITPLTKDFEIEKYRNNNIEKVEHSLKSESSDTFLPSESSESVCDCSE